MFPTKLDESRIVFGKITITLEAIRLDDNLSLTRRLEISNHVHGFPFLTPCSTKFPVSANFLSRKFSRGTGATWRVPPIRRAGGSLNT